jgi:hypothetical protein
MEFDHMTSRYLYPDKYIKMKPYCLNILLNVHVFQLKIVKLSKQASIVFFTDGKTCFPAML